MSYVIEVLRQEHCNIESLLCVLERELTVFDRGDRPNYELVLAAIDYFRITGFLPSSEGGYDLRSLKGREHHARS